MPSRCDLNSRIGLPALASSKRLATRLIISPLWYSFGPNTLKNFSPAHCGGTLLLARDALDQREIEQVLAPAVRFIGLSRFSAASDQSSEKPAAPSP